MRFAHPRFTVTAAVGRQDDRHVLSLANLGAGRVMGGELSTSPMSTWSSGTLISTNLTVDWTLCCCPMGWWAVGGFGQNGDVDNVGGPECLGLLEAGSNPVDDDDPGAAFGGDGVEP